MVWLLFISFITVPNLSLIKSDPINTRYHLLEPQRYSAENVPQNPFGVNSRYASQQESKVIVGNYSLADILAAIDSEQAVLHHVRSGISEPFEDANSTDHWTPLIIDHLKKRGINEQETNAALNWTDPSWWDSVIDSVFGGEGLKEFEKAKIDFVEHRLIPPAATTTNTTTDPLDQLIDFLLERSGNNKPNMGPTLKELAYLLTTTTTSSPKIGSTTGLSLTNIDTENEEKIDSIIAELMKGFGDDPPSSQTPKPNNALTKEVIDVQDVFHVPKVLVTVSNKPSLNEQTTEPTKTAAQYSADQHLSRTVQHPPGRREYNSVPAEPLPKRYFAPSRPFITKNTSSKILTANAHLQTQNSVFRFTEDPKVMTSMPHKKPNGMIALTMAAPMPPVIQTMSIQSATGMQPTMPPRSLITANQYMQQTHAAASAQKSFETPVINFVSKYEIKSTEAKPADMLEPDWFQTPRRNLSLWELYSKFDDLPKSPNNPFHMRPSLPPSRIAALPEATTYSPTSSSHYSTRRLQIFRFRTVPQPSAAITVGQSPPVKLITAEPLNERLPQPRQSHPQNPPIHSDGKSGLRKRSILLETALIGTVTGFVFILIGIFVLTLTFWRRPRRSGKVSSSASSTLGAPRAYSPRNELETSFHRRETYAAKTTVHPHPSDRHLRAYYAVDSSAPPCRTAQSHLDTSTALMF